MLLHDPYRSALWRILHAVILRLQKKQLHKCRIYTY